MANTGAFVLASKRPSIKEWCNLRVCFVLNFISFIPRSKLEPERLNQIDTSFLTPSTADNIHQTAYWKILGNEGDADPFIKKDEVCTTERIVTDESNATSTYVL